RGHAETSHPCHSVSEHCIPPCGSDLRTDPPDSIAVLLLTCRCASLADSASEVRGAQDLHIGLRTGAAPHDGPELHEREGVGNLEGVLGVLFDEEHRGSRVAQLEDGAYDLVG